MLCLLQRVREARVEVQQRCIGEIGQGLLVMVGFEPDDTEAVRTKLLLRLLDYRVFEDPNGRMNLSLRDIAGGLLLVPQFTLAADTRKGLRPGFSSAAEPQQARHWFEHWVEEARRHYNAVESGQFGADMQVFLQNDGPATFLLKND